jgi:hypothetical protein
MRAIGAIFACVGVTQHSGQNRLLALGKRDATLSATHFLVAADSRAYGCIDFSRRWHNNVVAVVAASEHQSEQQVLLLLAQGGQFQTTAGIWSVQRNKGHDRLVVTDEPLREKVA